MQTDAYTAVLNQLALMSRDPLIYLAIDEKSGSFSEDEIIAIRIAKAFALVDTLRLEEALELARENQRVLISTNRPNCSILNYYIIIAVKIRKSISEGQVDNINSAKALLNRHSTMEIRVLLQCMELGIKISTMHRKELQGELQSVIKNLEQVEHPLIRTLILRFLGRAYMDIRQYEAAQDYLLLAYDAAQRDQLNLYLMEVCNDLVATCGQLMLSERTERFFELAQNLIEQLRLPRFRVYLFFNYGLAKYRQKDYRGAILFFKDSMEILGQSGMDFDRLEFSALIFLANSLNALQEEDKALEYWLLAEKKVKQAGALEMQAEISLNIAKAQIKQENWDEAFARLKAAIAHFTKYDKYEKMIEANRTLALYYRRRKDFMRMLVVERRLDAVSQKYIENLQHSQSKLDDKTFQKIISDNKNLRDKYNTLLYEVSRRQAARFRGESPAAKRVIDSAVLAAMHLDANILLQGESGSGKEIVAQMIHYSSEAKNLPFIKVNCAAIAPEMYDLEFFGAAAGYQEEGEPERIGFFAQAAEGTLYLDEITELPEAFQNKLQSVLDAKSYIPLGKSQAQEIRCRIISGTAKDILKCLTQKKFKMELLHRLNTLEISVPPLRERKEDIPTLVEVFASEFARETSKRFPKIRESFFKRLSNYDFPGNTRELRNIIERIFILHYTAIWTADLLDYIDVFKRDSVLRGSLLEHNVEEFESQRIIEALRKTGGKQKTAAQLLNMTESTLCRKIKRYNIK